MPMTVPLAATTVTARPASLAAPMDALMSLASSAAPALQASLWILIRSRASVSYTLM